MHKQLYYTKKLRKIVKGFQRKQQVTKSKYLSLQIVSSIQWISVVQQGGMLFEFHFFINYSNILTHFPSSLMLWFIWQIQLMFPNLETSFLHHLYFFFRYTIPVCQKLTTLMHLCKRRACLGVTQHCNSNKTRLKAGSKIYQW